MDIKIILTALVIQAIVGFIAGGLGVWIGVAVLKEKVANLKRDVKKVEVQLGRVVYRDICGKCSERTEEKHNDLVGLIGILRQEFKDYEKVAEATQVQTMKSFRECMDDLVSQLKKK